MKILQFKRGQQVRLGICQGGQVVDVAAAYAATGGGNPGEVAALASTFDVLNHDGGLALAQRVANEALTRGNPEHVLPLASLKLAVPITRPEKIIGIGINYTDHIKEMGHAMPEVMVNFAMFGNALVGPSDPIVIPRNSEKIDWEVELVFIVGKSGRFIPKERAMDYVLGYSVGNDVTVRDHLAADRHLLRGKTNDGHAPMGPWIITKDEVGDPSDLSLKLWVNGVLKQSGTTANMIFSIADIVAFMSQYFTLRPGDVIFTGTPAGVGMASKPPEWLKAGDRVELEIERVGRLTNMCVAESV